MKRFQMIYFSWVPHVGRRLVAVYMANTIFLFGLVIAFFTHVVVVLAVTKAC